MALRRFLPLIVLCCANSALAEENTLLLIGSDEKGAAIEDVLSASDYVEKLSMALSVTRDATLAALAQQKNNRVWQLGTVVVGATVSAEAGIGSVIKLKAAPSFKLAFSNSEDPVLP